MVVCFALALAIALPLWAARPARTLVRAALARAGASQPQRVGAAAKPAIEAAELRLMTGPRRGVWAELKVILDNPQVLAATSTTLLVSGTLLDDYELQETDPRLLAPPRRLVDGQYALVFPPPLDRSLNWYRVHLVARSSAPRPVRLSIVLDGTGPLQETSAREARVLLVDREADPFMIVPEPLVGWLPGQGRGVFPILVVYAVAVALVAIAGCIAAFWLVRR
ncbi:MAG: hypothetical protein HY332_24200 [Chloroflexi bacterium]|nr:hypothetical protein [Chloroflexota bacterium]